MQENFFTKNKSILTFLILEVVALTAFNFGNISYIFGLAGAFLAVVGLFFFLGTSKSKKDGLFVLIPVILLLAISLIGTFNKFGSQNYSTFLNVSFLLSVPAFFALGFFLRKLEDVKTKTVLLVVGAALALITLFGLLSTLIQYGFFYKLIYRNKPLYYYNGVPYDVTKEMYWLNGFGFTEVFIEYGSLFAIMCAAFLPGLLFISPKQERNEFIVCAVIGGVGLLTLLIIPHLGGLLVLAVVSLFGFLYKFFGKNKKVMKIAGISFLVIVGLVFLFFALALINSLAGYKFSGILNRIFVQNRYMMNVVQVFQIEKIGTKSLNLFGLDMIYDAKNVTWLETYMFEAQIIKEAGLIGALLFFLFMLVSGFFVFHYFKNGKDSPAEKTIFISMILAFFVFESLFHVVSIAPHESLYNSFLRSPKLLTVLFLMGFVFTLPEEKEEEQHE